MRFTQRCLALLPSKRRTTWSVATGSALLMLVAAVAQAQDLKPTITFASDGAGSWESDGSWDVGVPGEGDVALIGNGGTAEVSGGAPKVDAVSIRDGSVDVQAGGTLETDALVLGGSGAVSIAGALNAGVWANNGSASVNGSAANISVAGDFVNAGTLSFNTSGADPYSIINVGGTARLGGGAIDLASTPDGATFDFGSSWPIISGSVSGQPTAITVGGAAPSLPRGLGLEIAVDGDTASVAVGSKPIAIVDRVTGNVSVTNVAGGALEIKGYSLTSAGGLLNAEGWNSLADQGAAGWGEANPLASQLSELNLTESSTLDVNETVDLGTAYAGGATPPRSEDVGFSYWLADGRTFTGAVEYSGPANDLVLNVDPDTGEATLQNLSALAGDFDITAYNILSPSGALNPAGFSGLGEAGWVSANPNANSLAELNLEGSKVFSEGTVVALGSIFTPGSTMDLQLIYGDTALAQLDGTVEYGDGGGVVIPPPVSLPGDADGDGDVDFDDFVILSNTFNQAVDPPGSGADFSGNGVVDFDDFVALSNNFGATAAASVPEPSSVFLVFIGILGMLKFRKRAPAIAATMLVAGALAAPNQAVAQNEIFTRFIRIHPAGPNAQINNVVEARGILNGSIVDVVKNADLEGTALTADFGGGGGSFSAGQEPWLNGVADASMDDFLQYISGTWEIPEGDWTIGFGSDDGGFLRLTDVNFIETFNENGPGRVDGDGEILANAPRGHAWTSGTISVPAGGITTGIEALFHERGGGDSFEVAVFDVHYDPDVDGGLNEFMAQGIELDNGEFGDWTLTDVPFGGGVAGDFNADGDVNADDFAILAGNFGMAGAGDLTGDGVVGLDDASAFHGLFAAAPAPAASIPEPTSSAILSIGMLFLLKLRRRAQR